MVPATAVKATLFHSGYCTAHSKIVNPKGGGGTSRFYAVWALLEHPVLGYILFDTGYTPRFRHATVRWPDRLYRLSTPVFIQEQETAAAILRANNIDPNSIKYVIISHFHADHIGGMRDFANSRFICTRDAWQQFNQATRWNGVFHGLLKMLAPADLEQRILLVEDIATWTNSPSGLVYADLFGEPELRLVLLPGHARGMTGIFLSLNGVVNLLATDAAWDATAFRANILPSPVVRLFFDSWNQFNDTWNKLQHLATTHPTLPVIFTHCPETLKYVSHV